MNEEESDADEHITLRVSDQEGAVVIFKIRKTTPLKRLMAAYCSRQGIPIEGVRFLFDGNRLNADMTPITLEMVDNDVIDAVVQQTGG